MNTSRPNRTTREIAERQYAAARTNLLLMIILTAINLILAAVGSDSMMLFSATVPYLALVFGIVSEVKLIIGICLCFAVVILVMYALCWLLSKQQRGWMIAALVLFGIDTVCLIGFYIMAQELSGILDLIFHVWVLYYLILGVVAATKLNKLPVEEEMTEAAAAPYTEEAVSPNTGTDTALRPADMTAKARILLEAEALGHHICYRRVKRVNELVIDGYVYDDAEMLIETAHALNACIDGHAIQVGFDGASKSYLRVDGEQVAKKTRLW